ncbi:hypothetical protein H4S06_003560 [Coemansia sp. BCRC 34490]|nr:hypothetical protein H4S06_003560 [Coemansia sp. BCRC 34490]
MVVMMDGGIREDGTATPPNEGSAVRQRESGGVDEDIAALAAAQLSIKDAGAEDEKAKEEKEVSSNNNNKNEKEDDEEEEPGLVGGISTNATSMLRVLLPSLTKLDGLLESVWAKQDVLSEVLNRLATELEQFDELVAPPGAGSAAADSSSAAAASLSSSGGLYGSNKPPALLGASQVAAQKLRESRTRIANINVTLKKVRTRLDNVSMLAQAKILQQQQQQQSQPIR